MKIKRYLLIYAANIGLIFIIGFLPLIDNLLIPVKNTGEEKLEITKSETNSEVSNFTSVGNYLHAFNETNNNILNLHNLHFIKMPEPPFGSINYINSIEREENTKELMEYEIPLYNDKIAPTEIVESEIINSEPYEIKFQAFNEIYTEVVPDLILPKLALTCENTALTIQNSLKLPTLEYLQKPKLDSLRILEISPDNPKSKISNDFSLNLIGPSHSSVSNSITTNRNDNLTINNDLRNTQDKTNTIIRAHNREYNNWYYARVYSK